MAPDDSAEAAARPHPITGELFPSPVPAGRGWPDDLADPATPVAVSSDGVARLAADASLDEVTARSSVCRACPRLVAWREDVAATKRKSFAEQPYWGRPTPGWGDLEPRVLVIGLAPAANGGNRTGRIFTGDRSGDWLFASLHRVGAASQPTSEHAADGLHLSGVRIVATVRCAPPDNKPAPAERDACSHWLDREVALVLPSVRSVVALGSFAWTAALTTLGRAGLRVPRPRPKFGHGAEVTLEPRAADHAPRAASTDASTDASTGASSVNERTVTLIGSYHPSQQNTFTGKLTEQMLDDVLGRAVSG